MTELIRHYGALAVFLLMIPESCCIPVPSEVTLMCAGFGVSTGAIGFPEAVLAATLGNLVGSLLGYGLGASGLVQRIPGGRAVLGRFEVNGLRTVFLARLMPLARTFVSVPAGAQRIPLGRFTALTTAGCAIWAAAFTLAGLLAGSAWSQVSGVLGKVLLGIGLLAIAWVVVKRPGSRREVSSEAPSPPDAAPASRACASPHRSAGT